MTAPAAKQPVLWPICDSVRISLIAIDTLNLLTLLLPLPRYGV